jgi:signal transduction histidine kinase
MAHEINNPLAIISGIIQRLERPSNGSIISILQLQKIRKSVDRIAKIVNGLRKFSRITPIDNKSIHSLTEILTEAVSLTEIRAHYMNTSIDLNIEFDAYILCNDIEIEQVVINIVNNAIDLIQGLGEKWIKIKVEKDNSQVVLRITDSGRGIPENISNKIFEPFFTTKEVGQGTGLGLSISKGIVEDHNGTISILKEEVNTCFEIRFPIAIESTPEQLAG